MWTVFTLLTGVASWLASAPHPLWRWIAATVAVAMAWKGGRAILLGRGRHAVRRFEWAADGTWTLEWPDGTRRRGCLADATVTLGPWILLVWTLEPLGKKRGSREYALIDVAEAGPMAFRALLGRLALDGRGGRSSFAPSLHPGGPAIA